MFYPRFLVSEAPPSEQDSEAVGQEGCSSGILEFCRGLEQKERLPSTAAGRRCGTDIKSDIAGT